MDIKQLQTQHRFIKKFLLNIGVQQLLAFFEQKIKMLIKRDNFSQPSLLIFTKGANISGGHCRCKYHVLV